MAKKKEPEGRAKSNEPLEEVVLKEEERKDPDEGLATIPPSSIEVSETETETEETEESAPEKKDASTDAILAGFNMLRDELRTRGEAPPPTPVKDEGETEEDFGKKVNEEIFKDDPYGIIKKAINREARKIVETEVAPILGSMMDSAFENAEFRLRNDEKDGPIYRKFEPEVKKLLKTLLPSQQKSPQVLKAVFDKVRSDHVDEIIDMREEARGTKLHAPAATARKPPIAEGGSSVLPGSTTRRVMIPKSELETLRRRANQLGVPVEVLVERRGE